uniref:EGF-like domain-containing protein n=1 Tax=Oryza nivara TaxID=4536 RepID=A0A0E0FMF0_ORYNI
MKFSRVRLVLVMVSLQAMIAMLPDGAGAQNGDGSRCSKVRCGMGSCSESSDYVFGFACRCNPGWSRYHLGNLQFPFLPCVIPNCTINYSCQNGSSSPLPSPSPPPPPPPPPAMPSLTNLSIYDPCLLQYCGDGGSCERSSEFGHRCACHDGFQNLLNDTSYPCYRQCSLGSDCSGLGISMFNGSQPGTAPPAPFSFTVKKSGAAASSLLPAGGGVLLHLLLVLVSSMIG